jgi:CO/xanthine dehydrogenase FAD-binding subunit
MKAYVPHYEMCAPTDLVKALGLVHEGWRPFAGGTDLMVLYEMGKLPEGRYLALHKLTPLHGIIVSPNRVRIGALSTFTEIHQHPILAREFPMLVQAARMTGAIAIQNRGSIGGNIANASPAADTPPALLCYNAEIELVSLEGTRIIPYHLFHLAYKKMDLGPGELIQAIHLPRTNAQAFEHYQKVGTREAQSISKVCFASRLELKNGKCKNVRLAFGSVAATPMRADKVESLLEGRALTPSLISKAQQILSQDITPMDDIRSNATYRMKVAQNILGYALWTGLKKSTG